MQTPTWDSNYEMEIELDIAYVFDYGYDLSIKGTVHWLRDSVSLRVLAESSSGTTKLS